MTLGKWIRQIDIETLSLSTVALWLDDDEVEEPLWEGRASQIPMEYLDYKLQITDPEDPTTKPIMVFAKESQHGTYSPHFLITVKEPY